jgi:hypothetical protein
LRLQEGRDPEPSAGLIDSQSVKGADTVGRESRGYDAGKKINGRKRFIVTDTLGLLLTVVVLTAGVQDRDGAKPVLLETYLRTRVRFVFADGGFAAGCSTGRRPCCAPGCTSCASRWPAWVRGDSAPVGGRTGLCLADCAPPLRRRGRGWCASGTTPRGRGRRRRRLRRYTSVAERRDGRRRPTTVWVPRTVSRPPIGTFAANRPRRHSSQGRPA